MGYLILLALGLGGGAWWLKSRKPPVQVPKDLYSTLPTGGLPTGGLPGGLPTGGLPGGLPGGDVVISQVTQIRDQQGNILYTVGPTAPTMDIASMGVATSAFVPPKATSIRVPRALVTGRYSQIVLDPHEHAIRMANRNGTDYLKGSRN